MILALTTPECKARSQDLSPLRSGRNHLRRGRGEPTERACTPGTVGAEGAEGPCRGAGGRRQGPAPGTPVGTHANPVHRTGDGHMKPVTPLQAAIIRNLKPPTPLLTPNTGPLKPGTPLRPKTASKTPISPPQRRWRFQSHTDTSQQRRSRFQTTGPAGLQGLAATPAGVNVPAAQKTRMQFDWERFQQRLETLQSQRCEVMV